MKSKGKTNIYIRLFEPDLFQKNKNSIWFLLFGWLFQVLFTNDIPKKDE